MTSLKVLNMPKAWGSHCMPSRTDLLNVNWQRSQQRGSNLEMAWMCRLRGVQAVRSDLPCRHERDRDLAHISVRASSSRFTCLYAGSWINPEGFETNERHEREGQPHQRISTRRSLKCVRDTRCADYMPKDRAHRHAVCSRLLCVRKT